MSSGKPDSPVIKRMVCLRAKYIVKRGDPKGVVFCSKIVPHPKNRGGEMIASARSRQLAADILYDGYDPTEACVNNLLVEAAVDENGQVDRKFTEHFLAIAGKDQEHFFDPNVVAECGALCHNTGNLVNRNIRGESWGVHVIPPRWRGTAHAMLSQSWMTKVVTAWTN